MRASINRGVSHGQGHQCHGEASAVRRVGSRRLCRLPSERKPQKARIRNPTSRSTISSTKRASPGVFDSFKDQGGYTGGAYGGAFGGVLGGRKGGGGSTGDGGG